MMGYIRNHAIIVTAYRSGEIDAAHAEAVRLGCSTSAVSEAGMNGVRSFAVFPDGSKEFWENSEDGDRKRESLKSYMRTLRYPDGSSALDWVEVAYGSDDRRAGVSDSEWADAGAEGAED